MAKQTEFPHPPEGHIGLLAYDSVNDKWYAVLGDADGHLQLDVLSTALAALAATAAKQLPDGHNVTIDNTSLAVTGAFYPVTQPVSRQADDAVPTNPIIANPPSTSVGTGTWTEIGAYTVTTGKTFYMTDFYMADGQDLAAPEFLGQIRIAAVAKLNLHAAAGHGIGEHLNTPIKATSEQVVSFEVYQSSGLNRYYRACMIGIEI